MDDGKGIGELEGQAEAEKETGGDQRRTRPRKDLTGMRFGKLTVLEPTKAESGRTAWRCRCDCGKETVVLTINLVSGRTKSCGCGKNPRLDLAGRRFGKLTVLEPAANIGRYTAWKCQCDCGSEITIRTNSLVTGKTKSCGCIKGEKLDLTGDRYGKLTVLGRAPDVGGQTAWRCKCDCGDETIVRMCDLRSGHTKSCGCLMRGTDLTGRKFGRLTVLERAESHGKAAAWRCSCSCGKEVVVRGDNLRSGGTRSCGCLRRDLKRKQLKGVGTHG